MLSPTIPDDLKEALEELGAIAGLDEMSLQRRKRAFLFIEQADNAPTRGFRVNNFVEVVKFFQQDSEAARDPDRSPKALTKSDSQGAAATRP